MTTDEMKDGIYYGMPEQTYHAIPRLSASGVKNLLISPMTFWTRSWLNPASASRDDTAERKKGRAYHARIVEGEEAFKSRYAYDLDLADHPDAMTKAEHYKGWLSERGLKVSGRNEELIARIREHDPDAQIWDILLASHAKRNAGKELLPPAWAREIDLAAAYIEKHPTIRHCFSGGHAEVSILWTHRSEEVDATGTPTGKMIETKMKSRIDRLKERFIIDLKTMGNYMDKTPAQAVLREIANHNYHRQAAIYYRCVDAIALALGHSDHKFVFVFQGTGDDPLPVARIMDRRMQWIEIAMREFDAACATYNRFMATHGSDPWVYDSEIEELDDSAFPPWMGG